MFQFQPYASEKGNIPDTRVSKINFPNNSFGASILEYEKEGLYELALTNSFEDLLLVMEQNISILAH